MEPLIKARDLSCWFPVRNGAFANSSDHIKAVDGVSLDIFRGETLGLVGESGCGKTTLGHLLLQLVRPKSGEVWYDGIPLSNLQGGKLRALRKKMQIVFQDPYSSLNPRLTIGSMLREALKVHRIVKDNQVEERIEHLLSLVGMPYSSARRYPHEFSSGQRQRIGIARALSVEPDFIVCDEPVSALDVSVQAQILNLLLDLKTRLGLTYLFITHDLSVVRHISDRIAVMYLGRIIELGPSDEIWEAPRHPYTRVLIDSAPRMDPDARRDEKDADAAMLVDELPAIENLPTGCAFHPRCAHATDACTRVAPALAPGAERRLGQLPHVRRVPSAG